MPPGPRDRGAQLCPQGPCGSVARVRGDGDGWTRCDAGHEHWGRFGAAGLLLRAPSASGEPDVLLQHRVAWSHHGGTWGIPGGARDSDETAAGAALREAVEETAIDARRVRVRAVRVDDHGHWTYDTVVADADDLLPTVHQRESIELRWVPEQSVADLPLHPGFAHSWPGLRAESVTVLVDAANVVGSRPDGWWRDRAGANARLVGALARIAGRTVTLPGGSPGWVSAVQAVVEGAARDLGEQPPVRLLRAGGGASGDDVLAGAARRHEGSLLVVTADRGLRARLPPQARVTGPGWLLDLLAEPPLGTPDP